MLTYHFIKYWIGEIWFFEERDIVDYVERSIATVFGFIPTIFLVMLDVLLSPIEIIAIIIYKVRRTKTK